MSEFNDKGFNKCNDEAKIGEEAYKAKLESLLSTSKIYSYADMRESPIARLADIDFAVFTKNAGFTSPSVKEVESLILNYSKVDHSDFCVLVDIKTDTVILKSGNVFLEMLMHGGPGCFGNTRADKWIYCGFDETEGKIAKVWSIDIKKVRELLILGLIKLNEYRNEKKYVFSYNVKINELVHLGAAKEITL